MQLKCTFIVDVMFARMLTSGSASMQTFGSMQCDTIKYMDDTDQT